MRQLVNLLIRTSTVCVPGWATQVAVLKSGLAQAWSAGLAAPPMLLVQLTTLKQVLPSMQLP
jgi:hypothetical protein